MIPNDYMPWNSKEYDHIPLFENHEYIPLFEEEDIPLFEKYEKPDNSGKKLQRKD